MVAVAIFSADPVLRRNLERLPRDDPTLVIVGMVDQPSTLRELVNRNRVDVLLADVPPRELLPVYRSGNNIALVVLLDEANAEDTARALSAGARAVLDRSASRNGIIAAIKAAIAGLVVVPANILVTLLPEAPLADDLLKADGSGHARLTRRELEVLAAMADGASNKVIARRLGISFHTVKFHVAAILAKLDADSRTEAVAKAAQLGLVML
jgi:two-component system, NarL family, response regulator YdfI